jgi:K+-sensing histidine kinase KdpD
MKPKRSWMTIDDLIQDARQTARALLGRKPVFFRVENRLGGKSILSDPFVLRGVLRTLIANAAKHVERGELRLQITRDSYAVRFALYDTGSAMPENEQDDALRPRPRLDAALARRLGDADLGLPLSRYLLGFLGGDLTVVSTPSVGSVFTITLPAVDGLGNELVRCQTLVAESRRTLAA